MGRICIAASVIFLLALTAGTASAQTSDREKGEALIRAAVKHIDAMDAFELECEEHYIQTAQAMNFTKTGRVKFKRYPDGGFLLHVISSNGSEAMLSPDTCIGLRAGSTTVAMFLKSNIVAANPDSVFVDTYRLAMAPEWITRIQSGVHNESRGLLHRMLRIDENMNVEQVQCTDDDSVWTLTYTGRDSSGAYTEDSLIIVEYSWQRTLKFRREDSLLVFTEWKTEKQGEKETDAFAIKSMSFNPQMVSIAKRIDQFGDDYTVKVIEPEEHRPLELGTPIEWAGRYLGGDTVSSADFKGGYVLYKFMYRGCGACHAYIPFMKHMQKEHPELTLLELDPYDQGDEESMRKYQKKNEIEYPLVFISRKDPKRLGVPGFPTFYMVDPEGKLVWQGRGVDDPKEMAEEIAEILGKE